MGDRYSFNLQCPNCSSQVWCYYAESCESTEAKCPNCKVSWDIVMDFKLVNKELGEKMPDSWTKSQESTTLDNGS